MEIEISTVTNLDGLNHSVLYHYCTNGASVYVYVCMCVCVCVRAANSVLRNSIVRMRTNKILSRTRGFDQSDCRILR